MIVGAAELSAFAATALRATGASGHDADLTAEVLVAADLAGVDSHGVARLRRYVEGLREGTIDGLASPEVVRDHGAVAVVDAHNGLGQPALCFAMDLAVERARAQGVAAVAVRRSNHIGIAGWYTERAARAGMFAIATTNATPQVAPSGAGEPMFGTDPISYAVPSTDGPLCFDAATSIVPRGKLERLRREGRPMRPGWAVGPDGESATDIPAVVAGLKARAGFALLPLGGLGEEYGGHKGSGLGLLAELLCGPLAGARWSKHTYDESGAGLGQFVLCLDLGALGEPDVVAGEVHRLAAEVRSARPANPEVPVRMPGDRRRRSARQRAADGIPLLPAVVTDLAKIAALTGIRPLQAKDGDG
ncbi:Ldh family oxidoreductase [Amycolatopsis sp. Poz14]|uniref:Ldh family oxidoreductase n=1 Tax=Amycolatopsis sp. Poz14 TaxID=1447705 RepID=UPI001EE8C347|nr:Ldh family oxidoreductase [Amycolatopsis sp. Poz14]MCG3754344.1 Ldh family oxidoreductase [Amycolatopsis sp. Poz14]